MTAGVGRQLAVGACWLALAMSTAGCGPGGGTPMRVGERDSGSEISVRPGQVLEIALEENPTTGYQWQVRSAGAPVLQLEDDDFQAPSRLPGAPGRHTWRMRVVATGSATVELAYARSWEQGEPARRFSLRVVGRER